MYALMPVCIQKDITSCVSQHARTQHYLRRLQLGLKVPRLLRQPVHAELQLSGTLGRLLLLTFVLSLQGLFLLLPCRLLPGQLLFRSFGTACKSHLLIAVDVCEDDWRVGSVGSASHPAMQIGAWSIDPPLLSTALSYI